MPDSSSPLQWTSTPNPPRQLKDKSTKWSTTGADTDTLQWRSCNEDVVKIAEVQGGSAWLEVVGPGASLIIASRFGESPICRYVSVGVVYAYDQKNQVRQAPAETWSVPTNIDVLDGVPTLADMKSRQACVAYNAISGDLTMSFDQLAALVKGCDRTTYFKIDGGSMSPALSHASADDKTTLQSWAYSPDGTLWKLSDSDGGWSVVEEPAKLPPDFPQPDNFEHTKAALAWSPTSTDGDFCVTCYILNRSAFQASATEPVTYFRLTQVK